MKQRETFNQVFVSILLATSLVVVVPLVLPQHITVFAATTCTDGIDNQVGDGNDYGMGAGRGDGKIDYYGTATAEPDPACISPESDEYGDDVAKGSLIPCTDKCGFSDVLKLLNRVITFVVTILLIPIFVLLIMYTGFQYLMAQGKPGQHAKLLSLIKHLVGGLALILCAWLIVRVIMTTLGYSDGLLFFD